MSATIRPLAALNEEATAVLVREFGVVDAIRFLSQFRSCTGDYTNERGQWLDKFSLEEAVSGIKAQWRKLRPGKNGRAEGSS